MNELETPEHDKLLGEHELEAALVRVFEWMSKRGRTGKGGKDDTDRVAICQFRAKSVREEVYCDDCEGTGKDITQLNQRQMQVARHMRLLKEERRPSYPKNEGTAHDEAMKELELFVAELDKCHTCYGEGKATVYRRDEAVWQPSYNSPRELLLDLLEIDKAAFKAETKELFAQLREQGNERPRAAEPAEEEA